MLLFLPDGYVQGMLVWLIGGGIAFWLLLRLRLMWRDRPRRVAWVNAGLSCWMTLALLTTVELYFALIYDASDSFNMTNVSKKWFAIHVEPQRRYLKFSETEAAGYRDDRDFLTTLRPDQKHVVFFGDSFTFAQGVPQVQNRFSNRVRTEIEAKSAGRILVSNLADTGTDLPYVTRLAELLFANGHRIDTAVYVLCLNDIEAFHPRHATYYADLAKHAPKFVLFRDTYFLNWIYFRVRQFTLSDVRSYYAFVQDYYQGEPWQRMRSGLDKLHQLCRSKGTDLRIVIFPFLHNLGPDYPFRAAHRQIVEYCQTAAIPVLDLEPILAPAASQSLTVNRFDAHPNELAHRLAAQAMLDQIFREILTNGNPQRDGS